MASYYNSYFDRVDPIPALREFVDEHPIPNALAVTLTLKTCFYPETTKGKGRVTLDQFNELKTIRHFMSRLNQKVYGNAYRRYGRRLSVLPVIEGFGNCKRHVHLSLEQPESRSLAEYTKLIRECWIKTNFGNYDIDVQSQYGDWIGYLLKQKSKFGNDGIQLSVDPENLYSSVTLLA